MLESKVLFVGILTYYMDENFKYIRIMSDDKVGFKS